MGASARPPQFPVLKAAALPLSMAQALAVAQMPLSSGQTAAPLLPARHRAWHTPAPFLGRMLFLARKGRAPSYPEVLLLGVNTSETWGTAGQ